jgi:hypothetical protein
MSSSGKTAIIKAFIATEHRTDSIDARGRGRSPRSAATRALLNLLNQKPFRRQRAVHIRIELSIVSTALEPCAAQCGSPAAWTV